MIDDCRSWCEYLDQSEYCGWGKNRMLIADMEDIDRRATAENMVLMVYDIEWFYTHGEMQLMEDKARELGTQIDYDVCTVIYQIRSSNPKSWIKTTALYTALTAGSPDCGE